MPRTIYECPTCGRICPIENDCAGSPTGGRHDKVWMVPVRLFTGDEVRPLWEAYQLRKAALEHRRSSLVLDDPMETLDRADAFPAPEDWKP